MIKKTIKHIITIVTTLAIIASCSPDAYAATEYKNIVKNTQKNIIFNMRSGCNLHVSVSYSYSQTENYIYIDSICIVYEACEEALDEISYMASKPYFTNKDGSTRTSVKFEHPTYERYIGTYFDNHSYLHDYYWHAKDNSDRIKIKKENLSKCKINCGFGAYCAESYWWIPKFIGLDGTVPITMSLKDSFKNFTKKLKKVTQ